MASNPPQYLTLKHHRDGDQRWERVARWLVVMLLTALAVVALLRVLGQSTTRSFARGDGATLQVDAPTRLRGGIYFQGRFTIRAEDDIEKATLVLDPGWLENTHINTIEPAPVGETSRNGRLALDFGHVPAGGRIVVYLQFQVNPTNVGRRSQDVELHDDTTLLASVDRTVAIFP